MTSPVSNLIAAPAATQRQMYENIRIMLEAERSSFISLWQDLTDFVTPPRGRFQTSDRNRGDRRNWKIIDSSPTLAARTCASGMVSSITSKARPWFRLTTPDPDLAEHGAVKEWLHITTERMRWVLSRSNFYDKCYPFYKDLAVYGTACMACEESEHNIVRFRDFPIGSYCISNGANDLPVIFTRLFSMTVQQLVTKFGLDRVSMPVKNNWDRGVNLGAWYDVVQIILENDQYEPMHLHSRFNKRWLSAYYEAGAPLREGVRGMLSQKGFDEMPVFGAVWETTGEDVYGTDSPGITALGDIRSLQTMERRGLQGLEKMVNPPMVAPTSMQSVRATLLPGQVTYMDTRNGQKFEPAHDTRIRLDQLDNKQAVIRSRVDRAFFVDLWQMIANIDASDARMTATEVMERKEEKLIGLGPVLEQLDNRFLDPMAHRLFSIMVKRGLVPPPPPDIQASSIKIEYISVMHQAQKASQMGGYSSLIQFVTAAAKVAPSAADKLNADKIIDHVNESLGNAPDSIRSDEQVGALRQARAQKAIQDQKMEHLERQAKAAKHLAGAKTDGKNALTDLTSNPDALDELNGGQGGNPA